MWQIATAPGLRHLPAMSLPVLLAADLIDGANPVTMTLAVSVAVAVAGLARWQQKVESRVDQHEKQLAEGEAATEKVAKALESAKEASQKRQEDTMHRFAQIEGREGRVDERMLAFQSGLADVKKGNDQMLAMISELLNIERSNARRRREDKDAA